MQTKQFHVHITAMIIGTVLAFTSCQKEVANSDITEREPQKLAASTTKTTLDIDMESVNFPIWVPCANSGTGEWLKAYGTTRMVAMLTVNENRFTAKLQYIPLNIFSVGQTTGDIYSAGGSNNFVETGSFINGSATFTNVNNFNNIGRGGDAVKSLLQVKNRVVVNADGTISSTIDEVKIKCQ